MRTEKIKCPRCKNLNTSSNGGHMYPARPKGKGAYDKETQIPDYTCSDCGKRFYDKN